MLLISKIMLMNHNDMLDSLLKRNISLKSRLMHEQLKYGNYSYGCLKKHSQLFLNEYRNENSLYKSASRIGMNYSDVLTWYFQGQLGNPVFKGFYQSIKRINKNQVSEDIEIEENIEIEEDEIPEDNSIGGEYVISQYGDGWSYKTFIDGEKIFLISDDLKKLKDKVRFKHLPLD